MSKTTHDIVQFVASLDEIEGYTPLKGIHWLEFYRLQPNRSVLKWEHLDYIVGLKYCIYSPSERLFFVRHTRERFDHESVSQSLSGYLNDGNLYFMLSPEDITATTAILERVYKYYFKKQGKLRYRQYLSLLEQIILRDEYHKRNTGIFGHKSGIAQFERKIGEILKS